MRKVDSISDAVDQSSDSNSDGDEGSEGDGESLLEVSPLLLLFLDFSVVGLLLSVDFEFSVLMLGEKRKLGVPSLSKKELESGR